MFEKDAQYYAFNEVTPRNQWYIKHPERSIDEDYEDIKKHWGKGAAFGYNKANEWFDAKTYIPLPKKAEIYRYTLEVISDKGDIVCYDFKDKCWKKVVIEDEKVTYVLVEIKMWCNKPTKEDSDDSEIKD